MKRSRRSCRYENILSEIIDENMHNIINLASSNSIAISYIACFWKQNFCWPSSKLYRNCLPLWFVSNYLTFSKQTNNRRWENVFCWCLCNRIVSNNIHSFKSFVCWLSERMSWFKAGLGFCLFWGKNRGKMQICVWG